MGRLGVLLSRWWVVPVAVFVLTRLVDALLVVLLADGQIALRDSSIGIQITEPKPASPGYFDVMTNWDGQWYLAIVQDGYPDELPRNEDGETIPNVWAFYPVYPALVWLVMAATPLPFPVAASLVSLVCGALAMTMIYRWVSLRGGRFNAATTVLALCLFPAAPLFQAAYTESLALLLVVSALWLLERRRYGAMVAVAVVLSLTRPVVLPLAAVVGVWWLLRWRRRHEEPFPMRERAIMMTAAAGVAGSFLLWPAIAAVALGRPDAYLEAQRGWMVGSDEAFESWLTHLTGTPPVGASVVALLALAVLVLVVLQRRAASWPTVLRVWAPLYGLYLVAATHATQGVFRYALLMPIPWWPVPVAPGRRLSRRARIATLLTITVIGLVAQYLWLDWWFIISKDNRGAV